MPRGSDILKVGLIGCGGRGTGAAAQAMAADPHVQLTAVGDAFADRLQSSLDNLRKMFPEKMAVTDDHCFVGFDAYKNVIDSGVDVVILATPPSFPPGPFTSRRRGRQARLCREAGGRRRARRAQRARNVRRGEEEGAVDRLGPVLPLRPGQARNDSARSRRAPSATS